MDDKEFINIYQNESTHYYYVDTHELILDLIRRYAYRGKPLRILDAGCGTGLLGTKLKSFGDVRGVDIHPRALFYAKKRKVNARLSSVERLPHEDNSFDLVVSVDVLYHQQVRDDMKALSEFYRVLKPGGYVIVRVPAVSWLRRRHDAFVYTKRRYDKDDLKNKLMRSGFSVCGIFYIQTFLFLLAFGMWVIEKFRKTPQPSSDVRSLPKSINDMMLYVLRAERALGGRVSWPIGLGLAAVAKKEYT